MTEAQPDDDRPDEPQWRTYCEDCDWSTEPKLEQTARGHVNHHEAENIGHSADYIPLGDDTDG